MAAADDVAKLFTSVLGRAADAGGLEYYTNLVNNGVPLAQVQQSLASSQEGQVRALYSDVFGRQADAGGQKFFADQAIAGTPIADIRKAMAYSPESQDLIEKIYTTDLKRKSDAGGKQYYTDFLAGGGLLSDVQKTVQASTEAQGLLGTTPPVVKPPVVPGVVPPVVPGVVKPPVVPGGTNTDNYNTINSIFRTVFGRDVDPTGAKYWGDLLASGTSIADITAGIRGSDEFQTPGVQQFQKGIRTVPFGSQLVNGQSQQLAQYAQPAAQAGAAMGAPSLQGFLNSNPAAAAMTPFQQQMQYQTALPGMVQPFNPADIPRTFQQTLTPGPRLDISRTTVPGWLQTAIDAQKVKDGTEVSSVDKFTTANQVNTNSGLGVTTPGVTTPGITGGLLAANQISPQILGLFPEYLGRSGADIDLPGASYWQTLSNQGTPIADIIAGISGSAEGLLYAPTRASKLAAAAAPAVITGSDH